MKLQKKVGIVLTTPLAIVVGATLLPLLIPTVLVSAFKWLERAINQGIDYWQRLGE